MLRDKFYISPTFEFKLPVSWIIPQTALNGQQPRPLFRAQAPLHGQETLTDPWSY